MTSVLTTKSNSRLSREANGNRIGQTSLRRSYNPGGAPSASRIVTPSSPLPTFFVNKRKALTNSGKKTKYEATQKALNRFSYNFLRSLRCRFYSAYWLGMSVGADRVLNVFDPHNLGLDHLDGAHMGCEKSKNFGVCRGLKAICKI